MSSEIEDPGTHSRNLNIQHHMSSDNNDKQRNKGYTNKAGETDCLIPDDSRWGKREMYRCCCQLITLLCIIPLVGGSRRDTTYGALVIFISVTGICLSFLLSNVLTISQDNLDIFLLIFIFLIFISFIAEVVLCYRSCTKETIKYYTVSLNDSRMTYVKIRCLYLLSALCILYCIIKVGFLFKCQLTNKVNHVLQIVSLLVFICFTISQACFITRSYRSYINIDHGFNLFFYALFGIVNILHFAKHSIDFHFENIGEEINLVHNCTYQPIDFYNVFKNYIKPITEPTIFEVSLLAILLYGEIILIKMQYENIQRPSDMSVKSSDENVKETTTENCIGNGEEKCNENGNDDEEQQNVEFKNTYPETKQNSIEELEINNDPNPNNEINDHDEYVSVYPFILATLCVVPMFGCKVLESTADIRNETVTGISYVLVKFCLYGALLVCNYLLHKKTEDAKVKVISVSLFDILLLVSAIGSFIYFTLHLISTVYSSDYAYVLKYILNIITTFMQTVLILNIRKYEPIIYEKEKLSLSNVLCFCSCVNFLMWIYDGILEANFPDKQLHTMKVFGEKTFLSVRHVLIPMIIYFRFKSFLGFLRCSNVLSVERVLRKRSLHQNTITQRTVKHLNGDNNLSYIEV